MPRWVVHLLTSIIFFLRSKIYRVETPKSLGLASQNLSDWASIDEKNAPTVLLGSIINVGVRR